MKKKLAVLILVVTAVVGTHGPSAHAFVAEKDVGVNCRIGANSFTHWTAARAISYDVTGGCSKIAQDAERICAPTGFFYLSSTAYLSVDNIDKQWQGCAANYTRTYAKNVHGQYLGNVYASN